MNLSVTRWTDLIVFIVCVFFLCVASYLQFVVGLIPCPLCIIQRFLITLLGLLFLMGVLFNFSSITRCWLHTLTFLLSVFGSILASRQIWLEHFPANKLTSCQATLSQYSNAVYFQKIMELFFQGTSNCGSSNWSFLSLSMPMWTLLFFLLLAAISLRQVYINRSKNKQKIFF